MHLLERSAGSPKAVIVPHSAVIANILQVTASAIPRANSFPGDKALGVLPCSHLFGLLTLLLVCPYLGISSVLFSSMPPFERFLDIIESLKVNHLFLAPPLVNAFLKHPAATGRHFDYFKTCIVAAAPLDADRESAFRKLGGPSFLLSQGFGMTETGNVTLYQLLTRPLM
jgi:4-coumarate--CoA ligase